MVSSKPKDSGTISWSNTGPEATSGIWSGISSAGGAAGAGAVSGAAASGAAGAAVSAGTVSAAVSAGVGCASVGAGASAARLASSAAARAASRAFRSRSRFRAAARASRSARSMAFSSSVISLVFLRRRWGVRSASSGSAGFLGLGFALWGGLALCSRAGLLSSRGISTLSASKALWLLAFCFRAGAGRGGGVAASRSGPSPGSSGVISRGGRSAFSAFGSFFLAAVSSSWPPPKRLEKNACFFFFFSASRRSSSWRPASQKGQYL